MLPHSLSSLSLPYVYVCRPEIEVRVVLSDFQPYFLRQDLSLKLELTNLARLAGMHHFHLSSAVSSFFVGAGTQTQVLMLVQHFGD